MASIKTVWPYATIESDLLEWLGLVAPAPPELELMYTAVLCWADERLCNPFVDSDGNDVDPPDTIKMALFNATRTQLQHSDIIAGAKRVKTDRLEEEFGTNPKPLSQLWQQPLLADIYLWIKSPWLVASYG